MLLVTSGARACSANRWISRRLSPTVWPCDLADSIRRPMNRATLVQRGGGRGRAPCVRPCGSHASRATQDLRQSWPRQSEQHGARIDTTAAANSDLNQILVHAHCDKMEGQWQQRGDGEDNGDDSINVEMNTVPSSSGEAARGRRTARSRA